MKIEFKGREFEYEIVDNIYVFEYVELYNIDLKSLEEFKNTFQHEYSVRGNFNCYDNQLTSLEGSPTTVKGYFYCHENKLQSLVGSPTTVGGDFYCDSNPLKSLEGSPTTVRGNFNCSYNQLKSLAGSPTTVGGFFDCGYNQLKSLEGCPTYVKGNFYCDNNPELRPIKEEIEGKFKGLQGIVTDNEYVRELFKRERIELFI